MFFGNILHIVVVKFFERKTNMKNKEEKNVKNKTLTIMMSVLAGMTALPMQAMPVFAESTEIRNTTEDGSSFVGDWSCGASGSKTMTINADGTYTAKNGDKEESGKWKMQNGNLMLDKISRRMLVTLAMS
ncbi:hypothetical protein DW884_09260 [Ruminococcus sp. AM40-10AC]|nr:hypothetical protein DW884_09260 [Ruminococcus sp. AM40-10AC]